MIEPTRNRSLFFGPRRLYTSKLRTGSRLGFFGLIVIGEGLLDDKQGVVLEAILGDELDDDDIGTVVADDNDDDDDDRIGTVVDDDRIGTVVDDDDIGTVVDDVNDDNDDDLIGTVVDDDVSGTVVSYIDDDDGAFFKEKDDEDDDRILTCPFLTHTPLIRRDPLGHLGNLFILLVGDPLVGDAFFVVPFFLHL